MSLIAHLAPLPGSTIKLALGLSFRHCRRRETFQRLDAVAGAVAHFQRAMMMDVNQAAKAMRDEAMLVEIEDFLEGFNQPTFRDAGQWAAGRYLVIPARVVRGRPA